MKQNYVAVTLCIQSTGTNMQSAIFGTYTKIHRPAQTVKAVTVHVFPVS